LAFVVLFALLLLAAALPDLCPGVPLLASHPPDLLLVLAVHLALRVRGYGAIPWAILLGLLKDAASLDPLGSNAFVLGAVAFLFCEGTRQRGPVRGATGVLATFGAALVAGWLGALRVLPYGGDAFRAADLLEAVPAALASALLGAALAPFLDRYHLLDELWGRERGLPA